jgi:excisionase family DNA binding protein
MMESLTVEQASKELHVSEHTLRVWIRNKKIPAAKVGKSYRINSGELEKLLSPKENIAEGNGVFDVAYRVSKAMEHAGICATPEQILQIAKNLLREGIL